MPEVDLGTKGPYLKDLGTKGLGDAAMKAVSGRRDSDAHRDREGEEERERPVSRSRSRDRDGDKDRGGRGSRDWEGEHQYQEDLDGPYVVFKTRTPLGFRV